MNADGLDAVYGNDAPTMLSPTGTQRKRRMMKPGMHMADGTPWTGNAMVAGLIRRKEQLQAKIATLQAELAEVEAMMPKDEPPAPESSDTGKKRKHDDSAGDS